MQMQMQSLVKGAVRTIALALFSGSVALALGPVDGEVGAVWWAHDLDTSSQASSSSTDAGAPGFRAELWMMDRYGLRAEQFSSNPDGTSASDASTNLDVMWRAFSPAENSFLAMGVGWQTMELDSVGLDGDTSGARLTMDGRVGLMNLVYAYGHGTYLPSLDDAPATDPAAGTFEDMKGYEYELGVAWKMAPFISARAGYRMASLDFTQTGVSSSPTVDPELGFAGGGNSGFAIPQLGGNSTSGAGSPVLTDYSGDAQSKGFFVGLGFHF